MAISAQQSCFFHCHVPQISAIYLLSISNQTVACIAFKEGFEAVQRAAEKVLCPDYWTHNTLIGYMPADNQPVRERRCVCKLLPSDGRSFIEKLDEVVSLIGSEDKSELNIVPVFPAINLFDTIQAPPAQTKIDIREVHGV